MAYGSPARAGVVRLEPPLLPSQPRATGVVVVLPAGASSSSEEVTSNPLEAPASREGRGGWLGCFAAGTLADEALALVRPGCGVAMLSASTFTSTCQPFIKRRLSSSRFCGDSSPSRNCCATRCSVNASFQCWRTLPWVLGCGQLFVLVALSWLRWVRSGPGPDGRPVGAVVRRLSRAGLGAGAVVVAVAAGRCVSPPASRMRPRKMSSFRRPTRASG